VPRTLRIHRFGAVAALWQMATELDYWGRQPALWKDRSMAGAVREVVKYCTKLTEVSSRQREDGQSDVLELHRAIRGRRLLTTTGAFRGLVEPASADELLDDPESKPCSFCGTPWETVTAVWDEGHGHYRVRSIPGCWNRGSPSGLRAGWAARSGERGR
jgi:hypothetical protein